MTDTRPVGPSLRPQGTCLDCDHHEFSLDAQAIRCMHPQRPSEAREVVRWYQCCPQFVSNAQGRL